MLLVAVKTKAQGNSLAEQIGFSDSIFDQLEMQGQAVLGESLEFSAYNHTYRLLAIWDRSVEPPDLGPTVGTVLLFQTDTAQPTLLWSQDYGKLQGQVPSLDGIGMSAPGDWNNDNKMEFAILGWFSGTAWYHKIIYIYQIEPEGAVVPALKGVIPPGHIVVSAEQQNHGNFLLTVADIRGEMAMGLPNCCGPYIYRYFEWRDGILKDTSDQHISKYFAPIGNNIYDLTTERFDDPALIAARLLELLMMYEAVGQRDAGWRLVQGLVAQAKMQGWLAEGTYVDTVFMPTMTQLYEAGQPFVIPELSDGSIQYIDFYNEVPRN
jgi:hypothetical protein